MPAVKGCIRCAPTATEDVPGSDGLKDPVAAGHRPARRDRAPDRARAPVRSRCRLAT